MKVLNLQCSHQHDFEGWFASEDDFHQQLERGLLSCPLCGDAQVRKMLSAPRLNLGRTSEEPVARAGIDEGLVELGRTAPGSELQGRLLRAVRELMSQGIEVLTGNAARADVLAAANFAAARQLIVAIPNVFEAGRIVQAARAENPGLNIVARAHADAEVDHLVEHGAGTVIMGEREIARAMIEQLSVAPSAGAA